MILPPGAGPAISIVLGLVFGSFANVCIHRIPEGASIVRPRSRCPACGGAIRWYDNLPVASWILLGARCRDCGAAISWRYPLIEAVMGAGFLGCYVIYGLSLDAAAAAWLVFACVVLWAIDARHFILPDLLTLTGLGAGLAFALARALMRLPSAGEAAGADLLLGGFFDQPPLPLAAAAGAATGAAIPLLARAGYRLSRWVRRGGPRDLPEDPQAGERAGEPVVESAVEGAARADDAGSGLEGGDLARAALEEGMGLGDVKMLAMVGAFLGPEPVLVTILAGSIAGCLVVLPWLWLTRRGFRTPIPFGPFLAFGALLALFAGDPLVDGYSRLIARLLG